MFENTNNEENLDVNESEDLVEAVELKEEDQKVEDVIVSEEPVEEKPALGYVADGVLGSTTSSQKPATKSSSKKDSKKDTIAVHSTRNVTWNGVGKVYIGYNIVTKEAADKWVTRNHIRLATPEEVAKEFGL